MSDLVPGANVALREVAGLRLLRIDIQWDASREPLLAERIGVAALPLVGDVLPGRDHIIFGNQPTSPDETTRLGESKGVVEVDLAHVPDGVNRIAVIVFIHPLPGAAKRTLSQLRSLRAVMTDGEHGTPIAQSVDLSMSAGTVTALIAVEVYRRGSEWKVKVNGQGFDAGLDAGLKQFGAPA